MIEDINIQNVSIPDISNWNLTLPPPVVPTIPHTTTTIGTPIIQVPGCVEAHPDAKKNKKLIADDPNGTVTFCDGTAPSFNPIEYNPNLDPLNQEKDEDNKHEEQYYFHPNEMNYPPPPPPQSDKFDLFANIDKQTWIIAFAVFLLGFFMGKTMQPVILRYT